jgi:hypothetical protein
MKLGSKPDAFQADGGSDSRYVLSDLPSDIVVHVEALVGTEPIVPACKGL